MATNTLFHDSSAALMRAVLSARNSDLVAVYPEGAATRVLVCSRISQDSLDELRELPTTLIIVRGHVSKNTLSEAERANLTDLIKESNANL